MQRENNTKHGPARTQPTPGTIRRISNFAWPEVGIHKGDVCMVRFGPVKEGSGKSNTSGL